MALSNNKVQRFLVLSTLYAAQGIPRGFMNVVMISYLAGQGLSDSKAGKLSSIIALPWAFKFLWAPVIDSLAIPSLGRRRPWILAAELMMAFSLLGFLLLYSPANDITLIGWIFFVHNCFASLQDVATDALAIDVLPTEELDTANGLMCGSKLAGMGLGAALLAPIMQYGGVKIAVITQFILLLSITMFPLFILERPGEKLFPWSQGDAIRRTPKIDIFSPLRVLKDLQKAIQVRAIGALMIFVFLTATSEWIIEVINKPFYTKVLGWSFVRFSEVSGFSLVSQMVGALVGGWVSNRMGRRTTMVLGLGAYGMLGIGFGLFSHLWGDAWFATAFLILLPITNAFGSVAFFSMAMRISWTRSAATVFTTMMALGSLGHVFGGWLIGLLRDNFGLSYQEVFWTGGSLMIIPLVLLLAVTPKQVDEMKAVEISSAERAL